MSKIRKTFDWYAVVPGKGYGKMGTIEAIDKKEAYAKLKAMGLDTQFINVKSKNSRRVTI